MPTEVVKQYDDYAAFVREMESAGWVREQLSIDENNTTLVSTSDVSASTTSAAITVTCPAGRIITTMGTQQVPAGADERSAHALVIRFAGTDDTEMSATEKVKIEKKKPSEQVVMIARDFYGTFSFTKQGGTYPVYKGTNEIYRWRRGIVLYGEEKLEISPVNPSINIDADYVKLQMDIDLWTKRM